VRPLRYTRAVDVAEAVALVGADPASAFLAGGTSEVDLVRARVADHHHLVDINELPLAAVEDRPDGGVRIGALARMSDVARAPSVVSRFPAIAQALLLSASEQLRNMASMGGNLCQRTRCAYLRDGISPCNKRRPGSGCAALDGFNRGHAILGTSPHCIATHPSDVAVALVAFDAIIHTVGPNGTRAIPVGDFFLPPGDTPDREHPLDHGELITAIDVPAAPIARRSVYLKFRDRQSYEFARVSAAAALDVDDGIVTDARLALGGVGTTPWRARRAEATLVGRPAVAESFRYAVVVEMERAVARRHNAFKVELAPRAAARALLASMSVGGRP
jgi:xanthine dehydrogenase YagS FAD-binding subunit